jgi:hypothetical protein
VKEWPNCSAGILPAIIKANISGKMQAGCLRYNVCFDVFTSSENFNAKVRGDEESKSQRAIQRGNQEREMP